MASGLRITVFLFFIFLFFYYYLKHIFGFKLLHSDLLSVHDGELAATGVWASSRYSRSLTVSAAILKNITASSWVIGHIGTSFTWQISIVNNIFFSKAHALTYSNNFITGFYASVGCGRFTNQRSHTMSQHGFVFFAQCKTQRSLLLDHNNFKLLKMERELIMGCAPAGNMNSLTPLKYVWLGSNGKLVGWARCGGLGGSDGGDNFRYCSSRGRHTLNWTTSGVVRSTSRASY